MCKLYLKNIILLLVYGLVASCVKFGHCPGSQTTCTTEEAALEEKRIQQEPERIRKELELKQREQEKAEKLSAIQICQTYVGFLEQKEKMIKGALDHWIGESEKKLVATWGIPSGYYQAGDVKYLEYSTFESGMSGGTPSTSYATYNWDGSARLTVTQGTPATPYQRLKCKITWQVQGERTTRWDNQGVCFATVLGGSDELPAESAFLHKEPWPLANPKVQKAKNNYFETGKCDYDEAP